MSNLNGGDECDACGGKFSTTTDPRVEAENDTQLADHEFTPDERAVGFYGDPTICTIDGWMKIEHDLHRNLQVHESCFLNHDDILVLV